MSAFFGERESGTDVRNSNVMAVSAIANILRTSLGPQGLDKMLVDDIGEVTVTNDGATILKQLEVQHPAAKVLVDLSELQDQEVGDGTTSVVLIAAELLKRANELVRIGIHPTTIIAGFKTACKEGVKYLKEKLSKSVATLDESVVRSIARTSLSSKMIGSEGEYFAGTVVKAVTSVKYVNIRGESRFPVDAINVLKCHGRSVKDSEVVPGYGLRMGRAAQGMPTVVKKAKIALLDFNLNKYRMALGVNIVIDDAKELDKIRQKEADIARDKVKMILDAGANVILTSKGIDDMNLKYLVEAKAIGLRRVDKKDLRRIAKATGGRICLTLGELDGTERFNPEDLGECDEVCEERVGDNDYVFFRGCKSSRACSLLLRGANEFMLDETERSVHDALMAVSRTLESNQVVSGGGCVEAALNIHLEEFARKVESREQMAINEFAQALTVIPKTLAINAAQDATELLARLRACHVSAREGKVGAGPLAKQLSALGASDPSDLFFCGLDLIKGTLRNNLKAGVVEPSVSKIKSLRFATEAAVTILRIDDFIKLDPPPEQQQPPM
uniref:T-complex protein 1 subunit alpha n=1 Tax=Chromera velia CCMP2878 TaxID=1169474 RepID=A0A0G4GJG7_9ALVE|mmetsp:Transcript_53395/g.104429  ORF Transcript_53395/g.104429 Transcript_53395/m.104429 type:complete len:558 (-) Transcript_53395:827-2500(-)|eukprot:Cvel_22150.t1-p1 / transcript=Cvel_22150.t1 / gene=Cvel_22150 / organism=Chromera_velia_CCMP2878 / gene_product=T-complex protein 1 subunit alpha, putative / transcript_product=T-complex protein 1 subunit alpha, putative / location=Cvel_scaffold2149:13830-19692(-) / protein_length=557 / sequence_SO=supercontig / SO=protein_coding / is_pseudo=false